VYQVFPIGQPPHHTVWRMMAEDTYAMAMEPSTNRESGRWDAKERGELLYMEPGEIRTYDLAGSSQRRNTDVVARSVAIRSAGLSQSRTFRGRRFSSACTRAMSSALWTDRSVPLGK
jgi:hypothetical protein